ncbi:MAG TPA: hypothetical protein VN962_19630 [Polyangia bacterium]|nr:hypothetical protein [Polyangia bacterium]
MKHVHRWIAFSTLCGLMACGGGGGGSSGSGGSGAVGSGGAHAATGGAPATGGASASGGSVGSGGAVGSGGTTSTGGSNATGGRTSTGGAVGSGGVISSGGTTGSGGAAGKGGTGGKAGATGTTGAGGAAGRPAGGASGSAGATGGTTGAGGTTASGGTTGAGGATGGGVLSCPGAAPSNVTAAWCSCEQYGQWTNGAATFYNDVWGSGAGKECIWATTSNEFGFVAQHPNTSGIKSYPNISFSPAKAISAVSSYTSSFAISVPSGGAWESAYDIWVKNGSRIEIMLWMYTTGGVQPIAGKYDASGAVPDVSNVNVGGHTWNVFYGSNGANDVVSLLRTSNTTSGTVDIKAILDWIIANKKSFTSSWSLDQVQFGFEITSDPAVQSFTVTSFSVSSS